MDGAGGVDIQLTEQLCNVVHHRHRLGVLMVLARDGRTDFVNLHRRTRLTVGNLGRHLEILAAAGHIVMAKEFVGRRPRTTVELTTFGADALRRELDTMGRIVTLGTTYLCSGDAAPDRAAGATPGAGAEPVRSAT